MAIPMSNAEDLNPADLLRHYQAEFGVTADEAAELFQILEQNLRDIRQLLVDSLRTGDREKIGRAGHSLKGLAGQAGLTVLAGHGAALEMAAEAECREVANDVLRHLEQWLTRAATAPAG